MVVFLQEVAALISPIVMEEGLELLDLNWTHQQGQNILQVFIDKAAGGVTLGDCTKVSRAIEDILEVKNCVPGRYQLEVSSPGVNRPLKKPEHFRKAIDQMVRVKTQESINGRKNYKGKLLKVDESGIYLLIDQQEYEVPFAVIQKANLEFF